MSVADSDSKKRLSETYKRIVREPEVKRQYPLQEVHLFGYEGALMSSLKVFDLTSPDDGECMGIMYATATVNNVRRKYCVTDRKSAPAEIIAPPTSLPTCSNPAHTFFSVSLRFHSVLPMALPPSPDSFHFFSVVSEWM